MQVVVVAFPESLLPFRFFFCLLVSLLVGVQNRRTDGQPAQLSPAGDKKKRKRKENKTKRNEEKTKQKKRKEKKRKEKKKRRSESHRIRMPTASLSSTRLRCSHSTTQPPPADNPAGLGLDQHTAGARAFLCRRGGASCRAVHTRKGTMHNHQSGKGGGGRGGRCISARVGKERRAMHTGQPEGERGEEGAACIRINQQVRAEKRGSI